MSKLQRIEKLAHEMSELVDDEYDPESNTGDVKRIFRETIAVMAENTRYANACRGMLKHEMEIKQW